MKMSPSISNLAKAIVAAQASLRAVGKDADNPFFKSHYTTLAALIEALREPFAANGLAFLQPTSITGDGSIIVETVLLHSSGEWLSGEITGKPVKNDPQGVGSLISYLKRYGLQAMVGLASKDDDDDGNAASGKTPPAKSTSKDVKQLQKGTLEAAGGLRETLGPLPGHTAEHMPFGMPDEIYTEMPHQKKLLEKEAKAQGVSDIPSLRHISMACKENGVHVANLANAVKQWKVEGQGASK